MAEFIAYAKANPGKLQYGTSGVGGASHLATLLFERHAGVKMKHIPYKGVAPAMTDLLGGHVDMVLRDARDDRAAGRQRQDPHPRGHVADAPSACCRTCRP